MSSLVFRGHDWHGIFSARFQCSIGDIEGIVSSGLGRMLNPLGNADKRKPLATPPQPQTVTPKTEREWLMDIFRSAFDTTQALER